MRQLARRPSAAILLLWNFFKLGRRPLETNNNRRHHQLQTSLFLDKQQDVFLSQPRHLFGTDASALLAKFRMDRKSILSSVPIADEGVDGEKSVDIDKRLHEDSSMIPDASTPSMLFDGVRFDELHICHIRVHKNNTKFSMTNNEGSPLITWTSGSEGFKNAKKGTNIAAQAAAITFSMKAIERGVKTIRVKIGGLGPGRMASIKGLQMGGMNIVSISDTTPAPEHGGPRPRKQRRL